MAESVTPDLQTHGYNAATMRRRLLASTLLALLCAGIAHAATLERARELYLSGDRDSARRELHDVLEPEDLEDELRAAALELLGRLESDSRNWEAALAAWGELTDRFALSPHAAAVSAAIRPLQALVACGRDEVPRDPGESSAISAPPVVPEGVTEPAEPPAASPRPTPAPAVSAAPGAMLIGSWGTEYEAAEETASALAGFLTEAGVDVRPASTEIPAIRGENVVLSYLLEEARKAGVASVLLVTTRFSHREFVRVSAYDLNGRELWRERVTGGTALKERRDRGKVSWGLVDRAKQRLSERVGTPDLPTR